MEDDNGEEDKINNIIVLPYIKDITERVANVIDGSRFLKGYRVMNSLGRIIKAHKDRNDVLANNNVVYKIKCINCNASYVGQTKRQLCTSIKEHSNNHKSITSKVSVLTQHMLEHSHTFDWKNTQILDTEPSYFKRLISEMLHIKEQPNGINAQTDTEFLDESYNDILEMLSRL